MKLGPYTKEELFFFFLVLIIGVSFSLYAKEMRDYLANSQSFSTQVGQVGKSVSPESYTKTTVLSPNGNEIWKGEEVHAITWAGIPGEDESKVQIILFPESARNDISSTSIAAIIASSTPNTGNFDWHIPATLSAGDYFVRIFCISFESCIGSSGDDSDRAFTIYSQ